MRRTWTAMAAWPRTALLALTALVLVAGVTVVGSAAVPTPAAAIGHTPVEGGEVLIPAPVRALPICETIPDPDVGGCFEKSDFLSVSVSGSLDGSGTTTVTISPTVGACNTWEIPTDTYSPSPCYSAVDIAGSSFGSFRCVWLEDSTGDLKSCPSLYRDDPRSLSAVIVRKGTIGGTESASCVASGDFNTYFYGGPANVPGARWSEKAPDALDCELTLDGPTPDNLMGASWLFVKARVRIQESGKDGLGRWESAEGFVNINGFLGPDAPDPTTEDPSDDPNVPGEDPFTPLGPFTDVRAGSFARGDIQLLLDLGITKGTSATTYGPSEPVTREQMAAFLARLWRALGETCPSGASPFTDVSPTSFARDDIDCIAALGITTGIGGTSYGPGGRVTREQMAAFLARLWRALGNTCPTGSTLFTDVSPTSFAKDDIACIFQLGITKGTSGTTYGPSEFVTREQMAAFLARTYRTQTG
jgi:S-layer homology domain